jgi:Cupin
MTVFMPVDNARTVDFNANDVGYVPSNAGHYIENTGETDLVFLETFATDEFMDVSLNQWLRRVPSEMLQAHLGITPEQAKTIPADKLAVIEFLVTAVAHMKRACGGRYPACRPFVSYSGRIYGGITYTNSSIGYHRDRRRSFWRKKLAGAWKGNR